MKKIITLMGMMVAATLTLTNCNKVDETEMPSNVFTVRANAGESKTTNDGMHTLWADGDKISVLYAAAGAQPTETFTNVTMTLSTGAGTSSAEFTGDATVSGSNDFYAIYPYATAITCPGERTAGYTYVGDSRGLTQNGYDSMAHLCGSACPLYGVSLDNDDEAIPSFEMHHLASAMELNITNSYSSDIVITKVQVEGSEDIVGSYFIDIASATPVYTPSSASYVSKVATVFVSDGTAVSNGSTAKVYVPIKPYTQAAGTPLKVTVYATVGGQNKVAKVEVTASADAAKRTFTAGKIKRVPVAVSSFEDVDTKTMAEVITIASALTAGNSTGSTSTETYTVENAKVMAVNLQSGTNYNIILSDATGTVLYFGAKGSVAVGDVVTMSGNVQNYYHIPEIKNGSLTKTYSSTADYSSPNTAFDVDAYKSAYDAGSSMLAIELVKLTGTFSDDASTFTIDGKTTTCTVFECENIFKKSDNYSKTCDVVGYPVGMSSAGKLKIIPVSVTKASTPNVTVSPATLSWAASETDTKTVTVTCGNDWAVTGAPSWATVTKVDDESFTVTPTANTGVARNATLTVTNSSDSNYSATVTISQAAYVSGTKYTWTLAASQLKTAAGSVTVSGVSWSFSAATYINFESTGSQRGAQIGSSKNPQTTDWTLSTSGISGTIKSVKVNACTTGAGTIAVSVGGTSYVSSTDLTTALADYSGTGTSSGTITITMKATSKALYLKSIEVIYE